MLYHFAVRFSGRGQPGLFSGLWKYAGELLLLMVISVSVAGCSNSLGGVDSLKQVGLAATDGTREEISQTDGKLKTTSTRSDMASAPVTSAMATLQDNGRAYKIGSQDVLEITVFKVAELSKTAQVSDIGTINYPLLGEVQAAGKTARDLERALTAQLGARYLQKPQVTVFIKEYNSQKVTVEGAVKKPGVYPVRGSITLLQTIAIAQGFTEDADSMVAVFRIINGKRGAVKYDVGAIRSGKKLDPVLQSGDFIIVGTSAIKKGFNALKSGLPFVKLLTLL